MLLEIKPGQIFFSNYSRIFLSQGLSRTVSEGTLQRFTCQEPW